MRAYINHKNTHHLQGTAKIRLENTYRQHLNVVLYLLINVCMYSTVQYPPSAQLLACRASVQQSEVGRLIAHTDSQNTTERTASLSLSLSQPQCFLGRGRGRTCVSVCLAVSTSDSLLCSLFVSVQSDNLLYL